MSAPVHPLNAPRIGVVIPCYRVAGQIDAVLKAIGPECSRIFAVDDASPDDTRARIQSAALRDPRVILLTRERNGGVGAAVKDGYRRALDENIDVVVKLDGDGQMDPADLPRLVAPLLAGTADYAKGNRFFDVESVRGMPLARLLGNGALSFLTKLSSGYWNIFDPTNGFTAIRADTLRRLPLEKIADRFFFESDMLFRLYLVAATVADVPLPARYADEKSNLRIARVAPQFVTGNLRNFAKRLFYHYFIRDFSIASIELVVGTALLTFGSVFGSIEWIVHARRGEFASSGTIMVAALPVILGLQMLIAFLSYDIAAVPKRPLVSQLR